MAFAIKHFASVTHCPALVGHVALESTAGTLSAFTSEPCDLDLLCSKHEVAHRAHIHHAGAV